MAGDGKLVLAAAAKEPAPTKISRPLKSEWYYRVTAVRLLERRKRSWWWPLLRPGRMQYRKQRSPIQGAGPAPSLTLEVDPADWPPSGTRPLRSGRI